MTEPVATLTVDGDPWDWTGDDIYDQYRNTVRIDGPLPTVRVVVGDWPFGGGVAYAGPLMAEDRVWLATRPDGLPAEYGDEYNTRFATATVAKIDRNLGGWLVKVTDVEALS